MTVYRVTINLQMLIDDRSGYQPELSQITEDVFYGITGQNCSSNILKRDVKIVDYNIMSEKE